MIEALDPSIDLGRIRDEWLAIGLATGPDDVELRDRSIDLAYRAANLDPPKLRVVLRSPLEGAIGAWMLAKVWAQVGAQVRDQVRDQVWDQVRAQVGDQVWAQVGAQVRAQVRDQVRDQVRAQVGAQVGRAGYGSHDANWLGFFAAFRPQLAPVVSRLDGLDGLARSTGWWWPFAGAVIFTPRPSEIHLSAGRLHRDGGPAVSYPDGFSLWRLNGIDVPRWLAEETDSEIDPRKLTDIPNADIRREFVRKVGIDRVLRAMNARVVGSCGLYELLELDLGDGRRRPYLKMQNPSVDAVHIEGVHPSCRTVQEALNYRNGLTPDRIDDAGGADWFQQGDVLLRPTGATKFKSRPKVLT